MLFGFLTWEEFLWELLSAIPIHAASVFLLARLLDLRFKHAFWVCECFIVFVLPFFRSFIPVFLRAPLSLLELFFLPLLASRGRLSCRIVICMAGSLFALVSEVPSGATWILITGLPYTNEALLENLPVSIAVGQISPLTVIVMYALFRPIAAKLMREGGPSALADMPFIFAAVMPFVSLLLMATILRYVLVEAGGNAYFVGMVGVEGAWIAAFLLLYVSIDQYLVKRSADARAEVLARGVEEQLGAYARVVRRVESVAKVRHDLRNQAQAALLAADGGERGRARAQVEEMLAVAKGAGE